MFPTGLTNQNEGDVRFWKSYIIGTLLHAVTNGTPTQVASAVTLMGGESHVYFPPDEMLLSGMAFVRSGNEGIVAFQGTQNARQAIQEVLMSPQTEYATIAGHVHAFFGANFFDRWAALAPTLAALPPNFRMGYCGHSLGGALAHIGFVQRDPANTLIPTCCVTFGQPRTGNAYFAEQTPPGFIRWNAQNDVVTGIPPNRFTSFLLIGPRAANQVGFSYQHPRRGMRLNNDGTYQRGNLLISDAWGPPTPNDYLRLRNCYADCADAHSMGRYLVLLHNLIQVQGSPVMIEPFVALNEAIDA